MNRNVLLSQMKERVEAAFVAAEDQSSADEDATESNLVRPDTEEEDQEMEEPEEPKAPEVAQVIEVVEQPATPPAPPSKVASEESSNSSDAPEKDVKIKNAILRNCFASLHRRQKIEKEKEYHQYLDNGN